LLSDSVLFAKADSMNLEMSSVEVEKNPYTVQVASYVSEQDAIQHVSQLRKFDKTSFYFPTFTRGQVWYKVCAGRFMTMETAENHRKSLVKKFETAFAVVISLQNSNLETKTAQKPIVQKRTVASEPKPVHKEEHAAAIKPITKPETKLTHEEHPEEHTQEAVVVKPEVKMIKKMALATNHTETQVNDSKPVTQSKMTTEDFQYTIQVASYTDKKDADTKGQALAGEGGAQVRESQVNGKTWYRVYLGTFETKREAEAFRAVYAEKTGDANSFVKRMDK